MSAPVIRAALIVLSLAWAAHAAEPAPAQPPKGKPGKARRYTELKSGVYDCELAGMMCLACAGMIKEELLRVEGVQGAWIDFDTRILRLEIKPKKIVPVNAVKRALARATRRIDLGSEFVLGPIRYVP